MFKNTLAVELRGFQGMREAAASMPLWLTEIVYKVTCLMRAAKMDLLGASGDT